MKKDLRVLVVEDSEDDTLLLIRELKRAGYEPIYLRVETEAGITAALEQQPWDIALCDHTLPRLDSFQALDIIKALTPQLPVIVVSGKQGEDLAVRVMKAGADDYVMKGSLGRLVSAVERELREAQVRRARHEAEEALKRNQAEFEDFFEHAPVGLCWVGADASIQRANEAALALLGRTPSECLGRQFSGLFADPVVAEDLLDRLMKGETVTNLETQILAKDGSERDVLINSNSLREQGNFIRARVFVRDITLQKQAQRSLAYLAALVESSEDAIIGKTLEGTIVTWNSGAQRMYGYAAQEVQGQSVSMLVPSYRPEELPELYEKIRQGEWIGRFETVRLKKDGTVIDVLVTLSPIKDPSGAVVGISAIERDITARKKEEEERVKLIADLTDALTKIKTLKGLLPICASCKKIRDDQGYWQKVETYISDHTQAEFTHGLCPDCLNTLYPEKPRKN